MWPKHSKAAGLPHAPEEPGTFGGLSLVEGEEAAREWTGAKRQGHSVYRSVEDLYRIMLRMCL